MEDYVQLFCFWGGEIVRETVDIRYTDDPKEIRTVPRDSSYEELCQIIFSMMSLECSQWKLKLSCKVPMMGVGGICGYYLFNVCNDNDVKQMLLIPTYYYNGRGGVYLFIEAEQFMPSIPQLGEYMIYTDMLGEGSFSRLLCLDTMNQKQIGTFTSDAGCSQSTVGGHEDREFEHAYEPSYQTDEQVHHEGGYIPNIVMNLCEHDNRGNGEDDEDPDYEHSIDTEEEEDNDGETESDSEDSIELNNNGGGGEENDDVPLRPHVPSGSWFLTEDINYNLVTDHKGGPPIFDPLHGDLFKGALFADKKLLVAAVKGVHLRDGRDFRVEKSSTTLYQVSCKDLNCCWRLRASKSTLHGLFRISRLIEPHTCLFKESSQSHTKISARTIADAINHHVVDTPSIAVTSIMEIIYDMYKYRVSYKKAWYGKRKAIADVYGDWTTSYSYLPLFMNAVINRNIGTFVQIEAEPHLSLQNTSVCSRFFWAFKAMVDGWHHARPVLTIDGTFLKGRYKGKLLVAMGFDSDNCQYPVAYAQVDEETTSNWSWFLHLLRVHVCKNRQNVCIISDRHAGILEAMRRHENGFTPPLGIHRFCLLHLRSNFNTAHPGQELKQLMYAAGITSQKRKFENAMKAIHDISPPAEQWLRAIPLHMWTLSYDGGYRYGQATTNMVESFNGNIKMARFLPVTAMVEYIFYKSVRLVERRRTETIKDLASGQVYCSQSRKMFANITKKATGHKVKIFNRQRGLFEVVTGRYKKNNYHKGGNKQNVDLSQLTCTCGKWERHHCPCSHVVAACMSISRDWQQWIEKYHTLAQLELTWLPEFYPLGHKDYWTEPLPLQWVRFGTLKPDEKLRKTKKKRGDKGSTVRIRTEMDNNRRNVKCSRCSQDGHTRRSLLCPLRRHYGDDEAKTSTQRQRRERANRAKGCGSSGDT